jgi:hypothetical protein
MDGDGCLEKVQPTADCCIFYKAIQTSGRRIVGTFSEHLSQSALLLQDTAQVWTYLQRAKEGAGRRGLG